MRPRLKIHAALVQLPGNVPVWYAADTNVASQAERPMRVLAQRLACAPIARRATAALSLGSSNRAALQALGFRRIVDLPVYPVDFAALDAAADAAMAPTPDSALTLLIVARLVPAKNLPGFVAALAQELELCRRIRLVIAGEGPDRTALEAIQGCTPHLKLELLGPVPRRNVGALFRCADALLLPSRTEPWGIVVVEALGMGLPVIATPAVGAAVSLAASTGAVLLSAESQPPSVVAAVRRFVDDKSRLATAAKECMPAIRARFDRIVVAKATLRLVYGQEP
jgi:glycosyltransferase involved in cell wall biosynthesis